MVDNFAAPGVNADVEPNLVFLGNKIKIRLPTANYLPLVVVGNRV